MRRCSFILLLVFLSGCFSGGAEVDAFFNLVEGDDGTVVEVPVPVPTDLQITIDSPSDNKKVGYLAKISGNCSPAGKAITLTGDGVTGYATCGLGGTWDAEIDFSAAAVGVVTVSAKMIDGDDSSGVVTKDFVKDSTACDSESSRNATYAEGDGSAGNPYQVCTLTQFDNLRSNVTSSYILKNDIDFKSSPFTPLPTTFSGSLDGNEFELQDVVVNTPSSNDTGVFSYLRDGGSITNLVVDGLSVSGNQRAAFIGRVSGASGATLSNLEIKDATISASSTGASVLVGYLDNSSSLTLTNITITDATISAANGYAGAALGYTHASASSVNMSQVSSSGTLSSGNSYSGGIAGLLDLTGSTLDQLSSTMTISSSGSYVAGLVGRLDGGDLTNSTYIGSISASGSSYVGGSVGDFSGTNFKTNSARATIVCDSSTVACNYIGGMIGRVNSDTTDMRDCTSIVNISVTGEIASSYVGGVAGFLRGVLVDNTIAKGVDDSTYGTISINVGDGLTTGGHSFGGFAGRLYVHEGVDFTVQDSSAYVDVSVQSATNNVYSGGFAGYIYTADPTATAADLVLSNLKSYGSVTSSNRYVGGFAGATYVGRQNSTITGSQLSASGAVTATQLGTSNTVVYVGGFAGASTTRNSGGEGPAVTGGYDLQGVSASGNVTSEGGYTAGLIGYLYTGRNGGTGSNSILKNATATGTVSSTYVNTAISYVAGLVARVYAELNSTWTIGTGTYATGDVNGGDQYTAGLIGDSNTGSGGSITISDVYSTGSVTMTRDSNASNGYVGGLIGRTTSTTSLSSCYATGDVSVVLVSGVSITNAYTGGLVGYATGTVSECYALGEVEVTSSATAGNRSYVGGLLGRGNALVSNSFAVGDVVGGFYSGGLVGYHRNGITDSFAAGNVTGTRYVGGLIGDYGSGSAGDIDKVYAIGSLTRDEYSSYTDRFGQLIGSCGNDGYLINGFYNSDTSIVDDDITSPQTNCNSGRDLTSSQMQDSANFTGFDFAGTNNNSWRFSTNFRTWWGAVYPYPLLYWYSN